MTRHAEGCLTVNHREIICKCLCHFPPSQTKHTPTPWTYTRNPENELSFNIHDDVFTKDIIATCPSKANSEFIVTACNSHAELVDIGRKFLEFRESEYVPNNLFKRLESALIRAGVKV